METVDEKCLEWALKHLLVFHDSDFFPKLFEYRAISHDWSRVKEHIMGIDLEEHTPKPPRILLAPKANTNYRIAHQLDPVDCLIYTALIYEVCTAVEQYRIPEKRKIACSYRIQPDVEGSFFQTEKNGWDDYTAGTEKLAAKYADGWVLMSDITDFYSQIYIHRIRNIIAEAGAGKLDKRAELIEQFLMALNEGNSRGIPVGPAASIVLAEAIMADIDNKVLRITPDFIRYVDDTQVFFNTRDEALAALHELTQYIHNRHRLVFSGEKTRVLPTAEFVEKHFKNEEREEQKKILSNTEDAAFARIEDMLEPFSPYGFDGIDDDKKFDEAYEQIKKEKQFTILSKTYQEMFSDILSKDEKDTALLRHILRKATTYRVRSLVTDVLDNFETLVPIIREVIVYLRKVLNLQAVKENADKLKAMSEIPHYALPFVNTWVTFLYKDAKYSTIELPKSYDSIISVRSQAMIALRDADTTWVKEYRDGIETLGAWDKRAVIYCSSLLSYDEMVNWLKPVSARGDILDKAIASYLISTQKPKTGQ